MKSKSLLLMLMLLAISFSAYAEEWEIYDLTNSGIPADDVFAVLVTPDNTKWIGTFSGGLASYDDESWQYYYDDYATIRCIAREDNGNIWIGTGSGAAVFDGDSWTEYLYGMTPIPYPVITEITIDGNNVKWMGTSFGGMASFDGSDWNIFDPGNSGLPDYTIYTINIDQDDVKWIGTQWGGLTSYNGSEWVSYNTGNSEIPVDTVYDIELDNENNIWMATYGGGVACFDGTIWSVYNVDNSDLPSNFTQEILIDDQGNIWVGTEEGLAKFDGDTWYSYNSTNSGLPADNVLSLELDAESRLWIGTYEGGLCCYQENNFGSVAGTVTDDETGEPIEGAVFSNGYFSLAETAADGSYSFEKIPGIYEVTLTKNGYNALTITDVEILSDEMTTLDITLLAETMDSPSAPTDVTVTPAASGIFQAEIAWTCPTTTIGGTTLTDLDEMRVYRDGTLIFTDTSPTIGAPGSHIDFSMLTAGTYTYGVVGFNDAGEGITVENTIWVGEDAPGAVDNLVLAQTSPDVLSGTLTWDNPTTGLHGGACNNAISGYHIERNDGVLLEVTGSATSYTDDTIPVMGTYCYTVVPYNLIGDGGSATSNLALISEPGVLILEDFSSSVPPADWYTDGLGLENWGSSTDNYAGGTGMEMMFSWDPPFYGTSRMCTMAMDTSNLEALALEFNHSVDDYSGGYTLGVATSSDGITWNEAWSIVPSGIVGPETVNVNITTADVGSATFQMCFYLSGDSYGINYWYIDDVMLTDEGIPALDPPANLAVDEDGLFTWDAPEGNRTIANRELESYNVYLDEVMVGNTVDTEWLFSDLTDDQAYTAGLEAIYDNGVSELVTLDFTHNPTTVLDPPTNLAVDEATGLFTWDAPEVGDDIEELIYDNGASNGQYSYVGYSMGTQMSPAEPCQILELKIHTSSGSVFNAEVWGWDAGAPTEDLLHTESANAIWGDWVIVDVSDENLMVDSDFVVAFGSIDEATYMSCNTNLNNGRSWDHYDAGGWTTWPEAYLIRAVVQYGNGRVAELSPTPVKRVAAHAATPGEKVFADEINHNVNSSRDLESYNVYLNNEYITQTTDFFYQFTDLEINSSYLAGVSAQYTTGESEIVTVEFVYAGNHTYGDIDDNSLVEAYDASLTLQYVVGMDPAPAAPLPWEEWRITIADVDGNSSVEAFDAALILQYVVGMINDFPVEGLSRFNPVTAEVLIEVIDDCLYFTAQDNLLSFELEINSHKEFLQTPELLIPDAMSAFNVAEYKFAFASAQYIRGTFLKIPLQRNPDNELPQNISLTLKINYDNQTRIIDLTCLAGDTGQLPEVSALFSNMPNPFNPETNIRFSIKAGETGILSIYNAKGQLMQKKKFPEGSHDYFWNANNRASGVYLYRLQTSSYTQTRKMLLLK